MTREKEREREKGKEQVDQICQFGLFLRVNIAAAFLNICVFKRSDVCTSRRFVGISSYFE